jgi:hypothetical protein
VDANGYLADDSAMMCMKLEIDFRNRPFMGVF